MNTELKREPAELCEQRSDAVDGGGSSTDANSGPGNAYGGICEEGRRGESYSSLNGP